jgi:hypothetical protein
VAAVLAASAALFGDDEDEDEEEPAKTEAPKAGPTLPSVSTTADESNPLLILGAATDKKTTTKATPTTPNVRWLQCIQPRSP